MSLQAPTHAKHIFIATSRKRVLDDLAAFSELNAIDGPIVVDYDLASDQYMAVVFYLPDQSVTPEQIEARLLDDATNGRR